MWLSIAVAGAWTGAGVQPMSLPDEVSSLAAGSFDGGPALVALTSDALAVLDPDGRVLSTTPLQAHPALIGARHVVLANIDQHGDDEILACGPAGISLVHGDRDAIYAAVSLIERPCHRLAIAENERLASLVMVGTDEIVRWVPTPEGLTAEVLGSARTTTPLAGSAGAVAWGDQSRLHRTDRSDPVDVGSEVVQLVGLPRGRFAALIAGPAAGIVQGEDRWSLADIAGHRLVGGGSSGPPWWILDGPGRRVGFAVDGRVRWIAVDLAPRVGVAIDSGSGCSDLIVAGPDGAGARLIGDCGPPPARSSDPGPPGARAPRHLRDPRSVGIDRCPGGAGAGGAAGGRARPGPALAQPRGPAGVRGVADRGHRVAPCPRGRGDLAGVGAAGGGDGAVQRAVAPGLPRGHRRVRGGGSRAGGRPAAGPGRPPVVGPPAVSDRPGGGCGGRGAAGHGGVSCWGDNHDGWVGDGTTEPRARPVRLPEITGARSLWPTGAGFCAETEDGALCWGGHEQGALGDGSNTARVRPRRVLAWDDGVPMHTTHGLHSCVRRDPDVLCWGFNWGGELGDGTRQTRLGPRVVGGLPGTPRSQPPPRSSLRVWVEQAGRAHHPDGGPISLTRTPFTLVFQFDDPPKVLVRSSQSPAHHRRLERGEGFGDAGGRGMAEAPHNPDQKLFFSEEGVHVWGDDGAGAHRFDAPCARDDRWTCRRTIANLGEPGAVGPIGAWTGDAVYLVVGAYSDDPNPVALTLTFAGP